MDSSGRAQIEVSGEEADQLVIRPLYAICLLTLHYLTESTCSIGCLSRGAGQEVGRSCILLEFKGRRVLLDCGLHPGLHGRDALPFLDLVEVESIELLLVTHFHLDHCGALPYLLMRTPFAGRCFMTHATKAVYRWARSVLICSFVNYFTDFTQYINIVGGS